MDTTTQAQFDNLRSDDPDVRFAALQHVSQVTEQRVDWADLVWNDLALQLRHGNSDQRAAAARVLCNLARSDPENRILEDLDAVVMLASDELFITARYIIQALWKAAVARPPLRKPIVRRLAGRYRDCALEANRSLLRFEILHALRKLFDAIGDESVEQLALELIAWEPEERNRRKYAALWKAGKAFAARRRTGS